jgi:hypothetical protein
MAIKTFTSGEVLTASDTNTYLNNSGLVLITSGITVSSTGGTAATVANGTVTVGTSNTAVTVSGAFSSTYDNYRIIYSGGTMSSQQRFQMTLGASATGYYEGLTFVTYATSAQGAAATNNGTTWQYIAGGNTSSAGFIVDLQNPFLAQYTQMNSFGSLQTNQATWNQGIHAVATSYSAFTVTPISSSISGGTIRVYGYRQV